MIRLTRLNGKEIFVNAELIKFIETTPDIILSPTDDDKLNVLESPEEGIAPACPSAIFVRGRACLRILNRLLPRGGLNYC